MKITSHVADFDSRPIEIADAEGCELIGSDGKRYLDFVAGWCVGNIGWKRKEVRVALVAEAGRGRYVPQFLRAKEWEEFASILIEHAPGDRLSRVFRCTSGSEAVEFAIKCSRASTGKKTVVSIDGVYHGHTYGAASLGDACSEEMGPCLPGFLKLPMPHPDYGAEPEDVVARFEELARTNGDIAAFVTEPVFTNAGIIVPPENFLPDIERICRKHGILFVMDEVATGFGRCGALFGGELWDLSPDIVCLGKGITGGYGTMAGTMVSEEVFQGSRRIPKYATFGWVLTDLAAARANVEVILRDRLWENAGKVGGYLRDKCAAFAELPFVAEVRGIGMFVGIDIVSDKRSRRHDYRRAVRIQDACAEKGLLIETAGSTLFLSPPLILSQEEADRGFGILEKVMGSVS